MGWGLSASLSPPPPPTFPPHITIVIAHLSFNKCYVNEILYVKREKEQNVKSAGLSSSVFLPLYDTYTSLLLLVSI